MTARELQIPKAAGLDENKRYYVPELNRTLDGRTLMNVGWTPRYPRGDFGGIKYHFIEKK